MNQLIKKVCVLCGVSFLLFVVYYGNFLPLKKSQDFIATIQRLDSIRSLPDFESKFSQALDIPSPIGQEELVRNMANTIVGSLAQGKVSASASEELARFVESYYAPIIARGRGMSFSQNLYLLGALNNIVFSQTKNPKYIAAAEKYFLDGLAMGQRRPQFLYGLFDVYRIKKDEAQAVAFAQKILSLWPNDQRIRGMFVFQATSSDSSGTSR